MKYLFINVVAGIGSTGRIAAEKCRELQAQGHECVLAYGRAENGCEGIRTHRIGTDRDIKLHGLMTRTLDLNGFCSTKATKEFVQWIREYDPDVIWLHNIHGYYLNVEVLFDYLKSCGKPIKWTLHDCWSFTGHCAYFSAVDCEQWKTGCRKCPQLGTYPACKGISNVARNYARKKAAFTGVPDMQLITPSKWLADLVKQSYLREYPVEVVYNTIDKAIFKPTPSNFREKYGLTDKTIVLGVANLWEERKGLKDFYALAKMLDSSYAIVLVGLNEKQIRELTKNIPGLTLRESGQGVSVCNPVREPERTLRKIDHILTDTVVPQNVQAVYEVLTGNKGTKAHDMQCSILCIPRTGSPQELAAVYTAADVFVNLTYEENYPTVNLEARACGTPVITYDTGGCRETLDGLCAAVVNTDCLRKQGKN